MKMSDFQLVNNQCFNLTLVRSIRENNKTNQTIKNNVIVINNQM
jgi:hypothetical protein